MQDLQDIGLTKQGPLWSMSEAVRNQIRSLPDTEQHHFYQKFCQQVFRHERGAKPVPPENDLIRHGVQLVPGVLPPEACDDLSARIGGWLDAGAGGAQATIENEAFHFKRDNTNRVVPLTLDILKQVMPTVRRVLSKRVVDVCETYLDSHFKLDSVRLFRSVPNDNPLVSFRWHCDSAPMGQLHVFVYLTDSGPGGIGGATDFLSPAGSAKLNEIGYRKRRVDERLLNLSDLPGGDAFDRMITRPTPNRGDAVVFPPGVIYHRGIPPRQGWRDALLLVLLPALDPWQVGLAVHGYDFMVERGYGYLPIGGDPIAP